MSEENPKAKNTLSLTERDVTYFFGSTVFAEGNSYQRSGRVLSASFDRQSRILSGEVQGSVISPYEVKIRLASDGIKNSSCSCRIQLLCKHGAALALELVRGGRISRAVLKSAFSAQEKGLFYLLDLASGPTRLVLNVVHASLIHEGEWGNIQKADLNRVTLASASYITEEDCRIAKSFLANTRNAGWLYRNTFPDVPESSLLLLQMILSTERCYWKELSGPALKLGVTKEGVLKWEVQVDGNQKLCLCTGTAGDITLIAGVAWYLNLTERRFGPLNLSVSPQAVKKILNAGSMNLAEATAASKALTGKTTTSLMPSPVARISTKVVKLTPLAKLQMAMENSGGVKNAQSGQRVGKALLSFDYGDLKFERAEESEIRRVENNSIVIYKRDIEFEAEHIKQLELKGLKLVPQATEETGVLVYGIAGGTEVDWLKFSIANVPKLKEMGWKVNYHDSFNLKVVTAAENWSINATEESDFWFSLDLGITIEGKKVALLPIIYEALRMVPAGELSEGMTKLNHDGVFYAPLYDGRHVALPFERVKKIVETFMELFDSSINAGYWMTNLSLPQLRDLSCRIDSVVDSPDSWSVGEPLLRLLERVKHFQAMKLVIPPANFGAELRPYQLEGLRWLNFLREFQLGGVLADDMGLGKTIQTLAHISLEKAEQRLEKPFLVVCPTSVLPNWIAEIEKFTPDLAAASFWGPERTKDFSLITGSDIVVTTYPLLSRDADTLIAQEWKAVVLDEAQMIKNPSTQIAQAVSKLRCDYRICLTGTPVENHLGELWSQFNFLMPGFLQDLTTFTKSFRTPIEKQNDKTAQKLLADRVRPFLLRRTKENVAKELPEKSIIIKRIELEGTQRDLYETVRVAMFEKVKDALGAKGIERSQIIVLNALLKLRQVCCDPRLVPLPAAKNVQSSAKLEMLISMLEELHAEGKRILLFSQFTSMLDLIVPELNKHGIEFVEIRGDTKDRRTPVRQFQKGDVPLFLLSLKSGGFGLNLTAADTVIHFDPWWNPAAENQATDRAHRIGQDKSVFVFKLIASGTIEERMLELQERKQEIADSVLDEENSLPFKLSAEDLESLFKPLK